MISHPVTNLLAWVDSGSQCIYRSAIHIAARLIRSDEPATVEHLFENARQILDRHPTAMTSSKRSYEARVRTACLEFLGPSIATLTVRPALTADEQISEALLGTSRWPDLQRYLLPGLLKAMNDLGDEQSVKEPA